MLPERVVFVHSGLHYRGYERFAFLNELLELALVLAVGVNAGGDGGVALLLDLDFELLDLLAELVDLALDGVGAVDAAVLPLVHGLGLEVDVAEAALLLVLQRGMQLNALEVFDAFVKALEGGLALVHGVLVLFDDLVLAGLGLRVVERGKLEEDLEGLHLVLELGAHPLKLLDLLLIR